MSERNQALLTLLLLAPTLTELVIGSTTITGFLHPLGLLFLLLGYSLPVLVLRECAVRCRLGFASIICLGIGFGIYNEGLWAKTIIQPTDLPIRQFDGYGRILDVNFPWALTIGLYHALAAVLLPLVVVHAWFPASRDAPWLSVRRASVMAGALLTSSCAYFLGPWKLQGSPLQLLVLLALIAVSAGTAWLFRGQPLALRPGEPKLRAFFLGLSSFSAWLILPPIAEHRLPILVFLAVFAAGVAFYVVILRRIGLAIPNLLLFGAGFYMQSALLALAIGALAGSIERIAAATAVLAVLLWIVRNIQRSSRLRLAASRG